MNNHTPGPRPTRYPELGYADHGNGLWRIVTMEDGSGVGPHYASKAELLADLGRYADEYCGRVNPLHAYAPEMLEALKDAKAEIQASRGYAFTGSRIPYERDPRFLASREIEARIDAVIAKAEGKLAQEVTK